MKIYIRRDSGLATQKITDTSPIQRLEMKRGDTVNLFCVFVGSDGLPTQLPASATGAFVAKPSNHYTDAPLFGSLQWTRQRAAADGYKFTFQVASEALTTLLGEKESVPLIGEVTWFLGDKVRSTQTISITCANDVYRDDDPPIPAPGSEWPAPGDILTTANLATPEETAEGASDSKVVTPAGLDAVLSAPGPYLDMLADDGSVWRQTLEVVDEIATPTWTKLEPEPAPED